MQAWIFTRHADVTAILRDHRRFSNDPRQGTLSPRQEKRLSPPEEWTLVFLDPPDHTRLRALALLHESSLARTMPTDRILTGRCDTTLVGRGRSSD